MKVILRIDVMGYLEIFSAKGHKDMTDALKRVVEGYRGKVRMINNTIKEPRLKIRPMYGDTIDITYDTEGGHEVLIPMMRVAAYIWKEMIDMGLLIRGGMAIGDLEDNKWLFTGSAMIKAASLEHSCSFPSVKIQDEMIPIIEAEINNAFGSDHRSTGYTVNIDGGTYLDPLGLLKVPKNDVHKIFNNIQNVLDDYEIRANNNIEKMSKINKFRTNMKEYYKHQVGQN